MIQIDLFIVFVNDFRCVFNTFWRNKYWYVIAALPMYYHSHTKIRLVHEKENIGLFGWSWVLNCFFFTYEFAPHGRIHKSRVQRCYSIAAVSICIVVENLMDLKSLKIRALNSYLSLNRKCVMWWVLNCILCVLVNKMTYLWNVSVPCDLTVDCLHALMRGRTSEMLPLNFIEALYRAVFKKRWITSNSFEWLGINKEYNGSR